MNFIKKNIKKFLSVFILLIIPFFSCAQSDNGLQLGADVLVRNELYKLSGKKIALVVNHTSKLSNYTHLVDTLLSCKELIIAKLFSPEHGIRGNTDAGKYISDEIDPVTGIKIVSLYGNTKKPTDEMLADVDVIIYDIQDVGSRYYTYISTLYYTIEAAAENSTKIIVLDRPNPIGGEKVEGPILDINFKSFVGITAIPIRHGMTVGELALLFNNYIKDEKKISADLEIIKMLNWERSKYFDEYFKEWLSPSPNINKLETAIVYPGTCLIEGTNISEGRGTYEPFLVIGAPYINSSKLINELDNLDLKAVKFEPITFTPVSIEGMSASPKLKDVECHGIRINVTDREKFNSVELGIKLLSVIIDLYPDEMKFNNDFFDKLAGTDKIRKMLTKKIAPDSIINYWQDELNIFLEKRNKYLLY